MEKIKNIAGGFVGINEGSISNSYTIMGINTKHTVSEFCNRNEGEIKKCFSNNSGKDENEKKQFCSKNNGNIEKYFYMDNGKTISSKTEETDIEELKQELYWNFENVKSNRRENKLNDLGLKSDIHLEDVSKNDNVIVIKNAKELYEFARKVNKGYERYRKANVVLKRNIDLKGKKWTPIGIDKYNSFRGTFNGNGYSIENFKIYHDRLDYVGFFGYLQGATICDLKLDCICKGKRTVGALAGINDGGKISGCSVITNIHIGETTGGFVGKNIGEIDRCSVMGKLISPIIVLPLIRNLIIGIFLVIIIAMAINKYYKDRVFIPVAIDPNVIVDPIQDEEFTGDSKDNKASFDFAQTLIVDSSNMIGTLDFRNPKRGNHNIVVKVLISDQELKDKLGTTGRSKEKQSEIEQQEGYNPETYMTEIYHSGLIERGYKLPNIPISKLEDGTELEPMTYDVIVSLEFYKIDTNEKAIVNTRLPVTMVVK